MCHRTVVSALIGLLLCSVLTHAQMPQAPQTPGAALPGPAAPRPQVPPRDGAAAAVPTGTGNAVKDFVVAIFPATLKEGVVPTRFTHTVRPDQQGRYQVRGLPPGDYVAVAVESLEQGRMGSGLSTADEASREIVPLDRGPDEHPRSGAGSMSANFSAAGDV